MKVYSFGAEHAPVILLLPGTCCHWKGNFGRVIPLLADSYRVLCISYDGFDETEHTEFPTILEETEKIETYIQEHSGGHILAAYGCSLGGSFVGLLAARGNIHMDYGILGSSDLDQASPIAAKLQTNLLLPLIYPFIRDGRFKSRLLQKRLTQRKSEMGGYGNALEAMSNEAVEYVRGIPVVKTFGQSVFSFKKFKATIDEYEKWVISYTKDLRLPMMFYTAAVNGVFAFLIAGGLLFTIHGVTPEFLLNLLFYIIITPVISLTLTKIMYMSENKMVVADALQRIDSVLDAAPVPVSSKPQHPQDGSVTLRDVHFSYDGKTDVIRGVSMDILPGQTVAFVGPSGGGKSTLANLICRFFDVQSGSVRVGGADVRDVSKEELMDTISFVFQNSRLLKGSILDNVRLGKPQATEAEVLAALKAAQCMDIIEKFPAGIHTVIGTKGVYLSGGEQQRIAIARAMLKNAPILILDEATAFADPDNEAKVQAAFARLAKGKTVLMIAHRLSTVANADCIYVVQDGQIAESGTKDELCAQNGLFARMWQDYQASVQWKVAKEG